MSTEMVESTRSGLAQDGITCIHSWRKTIRRLPDGTKVPNGKRAVQCRHCNIFMARHGAHFWLGKPIHVPGHGPIHISWRMVQRYERKP
jgi:hypothetical protein